MNPYIFDAAILALLGFAIYQSSVIGKAIMSQQETVDALVSQVQKIGREVQNVKAALADVQAQMEAANIPVEAVDLSALVSAVQAVDDLNQDVLEPAEPATEDPVQGAPES